MEYRRLGKAGLLASIIGIGVEHLKDLPPDDISEIFDRAFSAGVNYVDLVWALPNIAEGLSRALNRTGEDIIVAFHLGSCVVDGKYRRSRNPDECEEQLAKQLEALGMERAPVLNVHYVPSLRVWREVERRGIVDLAMDMKDRGLARAISVSVHDTGVVKLAAGSGVDIVMYQVSIANHTHPDRNAALEVCRELGVGVVAMKPFAGGELLKAGRRVKIPVYKTGWKTLTMQVPRGATPLNLLAYVLDQPGVCTAVTGISSLDQLDADLAYLKVPDEELDYSSIVGELA